MCECVSVSVSVSVSVCVSVCVCVCACERESACACACVYARIYDVRKKVHDFEIGTQNSTKHYKTVTNVRNIFYCGF